MVTAVAAVMDSPSPSPSPSPAMKRHRLGGSSVANWESTGASTSGGGGDFDLRHWRPAIADGGNKRAGSGMRRRWAPPEIEIPTGGGAGPRGYTSLRDIMSSPEYAKAASSRSTSPADGGSGGAGAGDVHMIRHPLVKHAAYAYLQLTPSARDVAAAAARTRRRRNGPFCRLILGCLGFVGAFFGR
uniref:Uncharacterized protein n=1 Tax=Leersia perrieri TaxID=77586 RepID=A0A0D9XP85_9ORYZ